MSIRHFPTGMPYREVGEARIIAKDDKMVDFLAGIFETFEQSSHKVPTLGHFNGGSDESEQWFRRIERILRNGLPHDDKDVAGTIAHAYAITEQALEAINPNWRTQ